MIEDNKFRVALSADFLDEDRKPIFPDIGLSVLDQAPHIEYEFLPEYRPEYHPGQLAGFDAVISLKPRVSTASLAGLDRLTIIARCGVGYDVVDLEACTDHDVAVIITPAGVALSMAESVVLFVLASSHRLAAKDRAVRGGRWVESSRQLGREPRDRVIGTIGIGNIASHAVRLLQPFRPARILAYDPYADEGKVAELGVELVSLEELLAQSDYVLVNCPLTPETRHFISDRELALMKQDAVLINTARGPIVDEQALIKALEDGSIGGAALDVFEQEPLDPSSPLTKMENVTLASHSIGWTEELFRDMGRIDCEGVLAISRGKVPPDVVNPEVLERAGFQHKLDRYRERFAD